MHAAMQQGQAIVEAHQSITQRQSVGQGIGTMDGLGSTMLHHMFGVGIRVGCAIFAEADAPAQHKLTHSADWLLLLPMRGSSNPAVPPQVTARQLKM